MPSTDLCLLSAAELGRLYRSGEASPVEATRAILERMDRVNPLINAYCTPTPEVALAAAREAEARFQRGEPRGPLDGVPISVKDNFLTKGVRTTSGSRLLANNIPTEDAPSVERLKAAGTAMLGKTNLPEFAWRGSTDNPLFGETRNPWDLTKTPGGSTGGGAAAVAAGLGPISLSTGGAGSIRIPATFCGLFGFKGSLGLVPFYPPAGAAELNAYAGPVTRTVRDAALMLDATIGPDDRDPFSIARPERSFVSVCDRAQAPGALHGLRIGWSVGMGHIPIDPEIATICQAAARRFEELGCTVEEADPEIPDPLALLDTMYTCAQVGAHGARPRHELGQMDPKLVATVEKGRAISAAELVRATVARQRTQAGFRKYFERYDLLLTPACAVPPFDLGIVGPTSVDGRSVPHLGWQLLFLFNYTGHPGSSAPCGRTTTDLPVGLQIVGPRHQDLRVMLASAAYEAAFPWAERWPEL